MRQTQQRRNRKEVRHILLQPVQGAAYRVLRDKQKNPLPSKTADPAEGRKPSFFALSYAVIESLYRQHICILMLYCLITCMLVLNCIVFA